MRNYTNTPQQVHAIEDAFADGMSLRTIVRKFHIGCQTARKIRDGVHPLQNENLSYQRCPGCGGKVIMPCVLCRVRKMMDEERTIRLNLWDRRQEVHTTGWR
ncbi:hypothetical protein C5Y96_10625 [Blastopirellula marina]|uniref:Resolvase HTH domain-containing protein n=1 Tax=Blastopirellula marina TaxID=124 RepID=A0A2S8FME5_9BACT|nr:MULTISPECIES: hypothetical protein [Pirellulaceae]PQO33297.1 hypothetical protein C5Y96_10625 [Blastopirellula marina]RCS52386.1 hypothetical protein DTL36_10635 [Bremerella cremea]